GDSGSRPPPTRVETPIRSRSRQLNDHGGSVGLEVLRINVAIVFFDGAVTDAQAQTRSLTHGLRSVERIERATHVGESSSRIAEPHDNFLAYQVPFHPDTFLLSFLEGIRGVAVQAHEHALELAFIQWHRRQILRKTHFHVDSTALQLMLAQHQRLSCHCGNVHQAAAFRFGPREAKEIVQDALDAPGFRSQPFQLLPGHRVRILLKKQVGVADHRGERVVQFVGHPGDQLTDTRQPLLLDELALRVLQSPKILLGFEQQPPHLPIQQDLPQKHEHTHQQDPRQGDRYAIQKQLTAVWVQEQLTETHHRQGQHCQRGQISRHIGRMLAFTFSQRLGRYIPRAHGNQDEPADRRVVRNVVIAPTVVLLALQRSIQPLVAKQVQCAGEEKMPVNLSPGSLRHQGHAPQNPEQYGKLQNVPRIVVAIEKDFVGQNVFVGINEKHVHANPPQQKNQKIQRGQVE